MMLLLTVAVGDDPGTGVWRRRCRWAGIRARSMTSRSALPMVLSSRCGPVVGFGLAQAHDQAGGGEEPDRYAPPAGEGADGDGEVGPARMPAPSVEHEVLGSAEWTRGRRAVRVPSRWGTRPCPRSYPSSSLDWGKPACLSSRFRSGFGAAGVLGGEQGREEAELAGGGVLDGPSGHASGQWQVAGELHDLFGGGLPCRAVRSLRGISRHLFPPCRCCTGPDRGRVRCPRRPA